MSLCKYYVSKEEKRIAIKLEITKKKKEKEKNKKNQCSKKFTQLIW